MATPGVKAGHGWGGDQAQTGGRGDGTAKSVVLEKWALPWVGGGDVGDGPVGCGLDKRGVPKKEGNLLWDTNQ